MELTLNDTQLAVLRWIDDGCPRGVMSGDAHKVSAAALRARDLIRTSGRGQRWRAEITERGRAYLSDPRIRRPKHRRRSTNVDRPPSKTEELVSNVIAAGGVLSLPNETASGGVNWRQRAYAAQRHGKVPAGKHLKVCDTNGRFVISLEDGVTGNELGADEVPVPARVARYHRAAREFREHTALHEVSRRALPRASRIAHALAVELEGRGHEIGCVSPERSPHGRSNWNPKHDGQLVVTINGHTNRLRIWEKGVGIRGAWEPQLERWQQDRLSPTLGLYLSRPTPYDSGGSGELNMSVLGYSRRQTTWGDRKRWRVEARLPQTRARARGTSSRGRTGPARA